MSELRLPQPLVYPERASVREQGLDRRAAWLASLAKARTHHSRGRALRQILAPVAEAGAALAGLDDRALAAAARRAGADLRADASWPAARLIPALAMVREAAARVLGLRPFDPQIMGAFAMLRGAAAEMATGEGKTLSGTLAAAVGALAGEKVHLITVNRYLAERDAREMGPLYAFLGLDVGVVTEAVKPEHRAAEYRRDVTICTSKDVAFDYMRDRLAMGQLRSNLRQKAARIGGDPDGGLLMCGLHFAIVDEADSVLVDEARTPLILSAQLPDQRVHALYDDALAIAGTLQEGADFVVFPRERRMALLPAGQVALERLSSRGAPWNQIAERERLIGLALTALHTLRRDEHYLVRDDRTEIIDEFSGRVMPDRSWSDGLQEMVDRKEGLALTAARTTIARTTYQRFYRRYRRLAGMSGTLAEVAGELWRVYRLPVAAIDLHRPDRKRFEPQNCFATEAEKWQAIAARVCEGQAGQAPVLIGTRTVEGSLRASAALAASGVAHVLLNAAQDAREAEIVARAGLPAAVTVATNMAGRGTDIRLADGVAQRGGLTVVVSEPHEAGRIDRQLIGRCGRQGDPGTVLRYVSLQDALLQAHAPGWVLWLLRRMPPHLALRAVPTLARHAQVRAERLHAQMREDLMRSEQSLEDAIAFAGRQR